MSGIKAKAQLSLFPDMESPTVLDLIFNRADITLINLKPLKDIELVFICKLMGIASYGRKVEKQDRIIDLWDLRHTISEYKSSHEGSKELADFYHRVELHDMCRRAKTWKSGNKNQLAGSLLGWRNRARRQGQNFLSEMRKLRAETSKQNREVKQCN